MKKFLVLFLALTIIFGALACGSTADNGIAGTSASSTQNSAEATTANTTNDELKSDPSEPQIQDEPFFAGYARADITPDFSVPLDADMSVGVADKLYVTVIAISDGENKALIISGDFKYSDGSVLSRTRIAAEKHGVPQENVLLSATHDHSSVDYLGNSYPLLRWKNLYYDAIDEAIENALADLRGIRKQCKMRPFSAHRTRNRNSRDPDRRLGWRARGNDSHRQSDDNSKARGA